MSIPLVIEVAPCTQPFPLDAHAQERQVREALTELAQTCPHTQLVLYTCEEDWFSLLCAQVAEQLGIPVVPRRNDVAPTAQGDVLRARMTQERHLHALLSYAEGAATLAGASPTTYERTDAFNADCRTILGEAADGSSLPGLEDAMQAADRLSLHHQERYLHAMLLLSLCCVALVLAFLFYDEAELRIMLAAYGIVMIAYALLYRWVMRGGSHERYIQYRVLAETLRVQRHLAAAGIAANVADDFPWTQRADVAWVRLAVEALLACGAPTPLATDDEVRHGWIDDQAAYHRRAAQRDGRKAQASDATSQAMLVATVLLYLLTCVLELAVPQVMSHQALGIAASAWLKIALGVASAVTLFVSGYYGSLSLERKVHDHERMALLFERAADAYDRHPEARAELFRQLAREEVIENGTWMSYCNENRPTFNV